MANIAPDAFIFTPTHYYSAKRSPGVTQALELWAAVFRQGVMDYAETMRYENGVQQGRHTCLTEDREDVMEWFTCDAVYPGSFVWLCHMFGKDVEVTRQHMERNWRTLHLPLTRERKKENVDVDLLELV